VLLHGLDAGGVNSAHAWTRGIRGPPLVARSPDRATREPRGRPPRPIVGSRGRHVRGGRYRPTTGLPQGSPSLGAPPRPVRAARRGKERFRTRRRVVKVEPPAPPVARGTWGGQRVARARPRAPRGSHGHLMITRHSTAMIGTVETALRMHLDRSDGQEDLCFATWRPSTGRRRRTALVIETV